MTEKTDIRDSDEKVVEIEMERLRTFTNHPFKVIGDSQMIELQDSIKKYGVLNPLIVRPRKEGYYEIISGHRRKYAAERLGYKKIPVIIRMMQDDEAVVTMMDSNLQREQITPSEKAYAYKMKYDAIKKKAGRKNCGQVDHNTGKRSIDVIGELCGDSAKQVQRYIKMTELIPALLDKVDDGSMGFTPAVQLSYLKKKEQQEIIDAMEATQCTPSLSQANLNSVDYTTSLEGGLAIERVACIKQGNWVAPAVETTDPAVLQKLDMLPYSVPGYSDGKYFVGVSGYWAIHSKATDAQKAAAKDFINWMFTDSEAQKIVVNDCKFIPPYDNFDGIKASDPLSQRIMDANNSGNTMNGWVYSGAPNTWGQQVAGVEVQKYLAGEADWDEVTKTCIEQWSELRKQQNN